MRTAGVLIVVGAALACAGSAAARPQDQNLPWPELLPSLPATSKVQPHAVPHCRRASLACIDDLLTRLRAQWRTLDAACDHRALFSLAYIEITQGLRDDLARPHPRYFRYPAWFTYVIVDFSNHYFQNFDDYAAGRPVPESWRIAYDDDMHGNTNAGQDVLLASNAHTQHDLPYIYAEMGMRTPAGASRKHDHDGVNYVNTAVFEHLEHEYADLYDPFFSWVNMGDPLDNYSTGEMVKAWREGAWRNAERLMNATTPQQRAQVDQSIDATANAWAHAIGDMQYPGYRSFRDAYCRQQHGGPKMPPQPLPFPLPDASGG
ncbi:MAG: DUF5995 family protein [Gaiellaceae bacterium]